MAWNDPLLAPTRKRPSLVIFLVLVLLSAGAAIAWSHGGKTHGENAFTPLRALQEGTKLFDQLIVSGKLDESWETGLDVVEVVTRTKEGKAEYRVSFHRSQGEPETVYIFFSENGTYSGSNFDGN